MKRIFTLICVFSLCLYCSAETLFSPTWGFSLDLPAGLEFIEGDGKNSFTFQSQNGLALSLKVYPQASSALTVAKDTQSRLRSTGQTRAFTYDGKPAALLELRFQSFSGWGLVLALDTKAHLLALAYGPTRYTNLQNMYMAALNAIAPTNRSRLLPGPMIEYLYPRTERKQVQLFGTENSALIFTNDAQAAQALIDLEYAVLTEYQSSPLWVEAWTRFYRMIHRDSFDRLAHIAFILEREWRGHELDFAEQALKWVQSFAYERDLSLAESDFVNLVSAATEGRGDCDSRSLLWAILLRQANIPAGIMISAEFSHACGLADIEAASGARFPLNGTQWLVAETTTDVAIGRIASSMSNINAWIGIVFD
ncbi:MAG: hypothetical protein LBB43_01425 [Spirochaetaceae bacterium]|jgi:hypothetical protein|nr:hypothetical protein [Spirochaetaceae bacterium]